MSSIPGELTDKGRQTSLSLGKRLRHLYVDQLGFLPEKIDKADMIYLRATPMQRALDSVQQTFVGVYPPYQRTADFPGPTIVTRVAKDETLHPNYECCKRLEELASAYGHRTAERCMCFRISGHTEFRSH